MQASLYDKCFKEEGCVGLPEGCVEQQVCEILLKYSKSSDGINFNLQGPLQGDGINYMAMALSEDRIMVCKLFKVFCAKFTINTIHAPSDMKLLYMKCKTKHFNYNN